MNKTKISLVLGLFVILLSVGVLVGIIVQSNIEESIIPNHLMNSEYSIEKCDELLEMGFYGKVGYLMDNKVNSIEEQNQMYDDCVEIANHLTT